MTTKTVQQGKAQKAQLPKRQGRRFCDSKTANTLQKRQAAIADRRGWPVGLGIAAQAVNNLELDTSKTGINGQGKAVNFLGHVQGSKSAAVDKALVNAAANGSFDSFVTELASELVVLAKRHDAKALKSKLAAHCRHYDGRGKVSFSACLTCVGLADRYTAISKAMFDLLNGVRSTL